MALTATATVRNNPCFGMDIGSITVIPSGVAPYEILWDDGQTTFTISNLGAGTYHAQVADSAPTVIDIEVIVTEPAQTDPYLFGTECEFKCFLMQMSCCQADQVYKLVTQDRRGINDKDCIRKAELMEEYLSILECWYREGTVVQQEVPSKYILIIKPYLNLSIVTFTLLGNEIVNYTFNTGLSRSANMDAIVAQLALQGLTATYFNYTDQGSGLLYTQMTVEAAPNYNCIPMQVESTNKETVIVSTNGFFGGLPQIIAGAPCLSQEQVNDIIEQMKCICGCGDCTNLTKLTSDQLN